MFDVNGWNSRLEGSFWKRANDLALELLEGLVVVVVVVVVGRELYFCC